MLWLILIIIIILFASGTSGTIETFDERMIPFYSPFNTKFHYYQEPVVSVDSNNITDRLRYIIKDLKTTRVVTDADIKLVPESTVLSSEEYNFVATLHHPTLLLLTRDESGLLEFGDIQHYSCRVRIGIPYDTSPERRIISDILNYYPETVKDNVDIVPLHKWTTDRTSVPCSGLILGHDYHIYAQLVYPGHTNAMIRKLTAEQPSHFMTIIRINSGDYFVTNSEKPFYRMHHYYGKDLYDLQNGISHYPQLSRIGNQQYSLYLPTINCRYILMAKQSVPNSVINKIMKALFELYTTRKIKDMTMTDIARNVTKLAMHPVATKIYSHLNLLVDHKKSIYEGSVIRNDSSSAGF